MGRLFGTDGIRGEANVDLTPILAYDLGRAAVNGPYNDHYKRHVYGTVARIWNTGGLSENQ